MVRILLSGGGTLGSVSPLIAIKEAVPEADYLFVGTMRGVERAFVQRYGVRYKYIWTVKFRRYLSIANLIDLIKLPFVFFQALGIVLRYRPHIILTSGSFVSVPVAYAGLLCGCTIFIHQQDASVGLANKMITWIATVVTTTFEDQVAAFPTGKAHWTGNPIRPLNKETIPEKDLILVLGGSSGAYGLNKAMTDVLPHFSDRFEIVHVLGTRNYYQRLSLGSTYRAVQFLEEEYGHILQQAKVVVTRAGMSTLTELAYYKKAALIIPMPDTHQEMNARFFDKHAAGVYVAQSETEQQIAALERILNTASERAALGSSLYKLFPQDANERYAKLLRSYFPKFVSTQPTAYFVGIGGIGISAIAEYFLEKGYRVIGSDLSGPTLVTKKLEERGARIYYDHRKENMPSNIELFIYSTAAPLSNEEIVEAKRRHIAVYSYKEYLGLLSKKYTTVAITGTHGKTTTTALTGLLLRDGNLDPSIIVGSFVPQLGNQNYHAGKGRVLVVEADEYRSDMLLLHPTVAVVTNIDLDHLDFYKDINDIAKHFKEFIQLVPSDGAVIINADDARLKKIAPARAITYGFMKGADYRAENIIVGDGMQRFTVTYHGEPIGDFHLQVPGSFNILNALAAVAVARHFDVPIETIQQSIAAFTGTWRRFEYLGERKGASVYSDYGHHPTATQATLHAVKEFYPGRRLILVFQPHSYDRTEKLFKEFTQAFDEADMLFVTDIYDVAGRDSVRKVSSKMLVEALKRPYAQYAPSLEDLTVTLDATLTKNDILLIMGAGNIDAFARGLV